MVPEALNSLQKAGLKFQRIQVEVRTGSCYISSVLWETADARRKPNFEIVAKASDGSLLLQNKILGQCLMDGWV